MARAYPMTFAEKLQQLRERCGLSRSQLADAVRVSERTLADYERGRQEPRWSTFVLLVRALGASLDEFRDCMN